MVQSFGNFTVSAKGVSSLHRSREREAEAQTAFHVKPFWALTKPSYFSGKVAKKPSRSIAFGNSSVRIRISWSDRDIS